MRLGLQPTGGVFLYGLPGTGKTSLASTCTYEAGVLWLVDRYMSGHAISLSHPGNRFRFLPAYGDAVSTVKWSTRLGREHHDDLAQFMLGMGYANEALHLPGISKRLEFDLASDQRNQN